MIKALVWVVFGASSPENQCVPADRARQEIFSGDFEHNTQAETTKTVVLFCLPEIVFVSDPPSNVDSRFSARFHRFDNLTFVEPKTYTAHGRVGTTVLRSFCIKILCPKFAEARRWIKSAPIFCGDKIVRPNQFTCPKNIKNDLMSRSLPEILKYGLEQAGVGITVKGGLNFEPLISQVRSHLLRPNFASHVNGSLSRRIGFSGQQKRPNQERSAYYDSYCGDKSVKRHFLRRIVHRLRCGVHSLLRDQVRFVTLLAFPFAALAGLGGFIGFDNLDANWRKRVFGRGLLGLASLAASICLLLGLP